MERQEPAIPLVWAVMFVLSFGPARRGFSLQLDYLKALHRVQQESATGLFGHRASSEVLDEAIRDLVGAGALMGDVADKSEMHVFDPARCRRELREKYPTRLGEALRLARRFAELMAVSEPSRVAA